MAMGTQQTPPAETAFPSAEVVEWHLPRVVRPSDFPSYNYALVILNQPIDNEPLFTELWKNASSRVAADGGANRILQLSRRMLKKQTLPQDASSAASHTTTENSQQPELYTQLDAIVGDLDSLSDEAREFFSPASPPPPSKRTATPASPPSPSRQRSRHRRRCEIVRDPDQYSTDFTKAVNYVRNGTTSSSSPSSPPPQPPLSSAPLPKEVVCLGGLGGRVDQGLSQLHHLYLFQQSPGSYERDGRIFLLSGEGLTFLLQGGDKTHRIRVRDVVGAPAPTATVGAAAAAASRPSAFAKHVGILPVREPSVISTKGLEWDVEGWRTEFGGQMSTSNHVVQDVVEVVTSRDVLFTIALRREEGYDEVEEADN